MPNNSPDPLDILQIMVDLMSPDAPQRPYLQRAIAEIVRLREVEQAAEALADIVLTDDSKINLPTAQHDIIKTIVRRRGGQ